VVLLFLTKEILGAFENNNISEFAHIVGGICGGLFGFVFRRPVDGDKEAGGGSDVFIPPQDDSPR
jgi:hypothetical protein